MGLRREKCLVVYLGGAAGFPSNAQSVFLADIKMGHWVMCVSSILHEAIVSLPHGFSASPTVLRHSRKADLP